MTDNSRKKVLWVEDDRLLGKILGDAIAVKGFDLTVALNGIEALNLLKDYTPDIIMVDLYLPGDINGYDILEKVGADEKYKNTPTVILSNFSSSENFGKSYKVKPDKYLLKAKVSVADIVQTLRELSENK
jgi:DNA-binding response OmpR family regulator